jgi:folylpolyglutamate synthase/dihydropteroate synthase
VFDVAHNPDGMRALVTALDAASLPGRFMPGFHPGRQGVAEMLVALDAAIDHGVLTRAPTAESRGGTCSGWTSGCAAPTGHRPTRMVTGA